VVDSVPHAYAFANLFQFAGQPMPKGAFGTQLCQQCLSLITCVRVHVPFEETLPTSRNFLFSEHSPLLERDRTVNRLSFYLSCRMMQDEEPPNRPAALKPALISRARQAKSPNCFESGSEGAMLQATMRGPKTS